MAFATRWVFTYNNPEGHIDGDFSVAADAVRYAVYQLEQAPTTGTIHYQGYVEFHRSVRRSACLRIIESAYWKPAKGSREQNRAYCTKEDGRLDGPWEHGIFEPLKQGNRTDLIHLKEDLDNNNSLRDIASNHFGSFLRYGRGIAAYRAITSPPRDFATELRIFYGPAGTGKSHLARLYGDNSCYWLRHSNTGAWFDNYDYEHTVVIDDFSGWLSRDFLCNLCDTYPLLVDTKGGYVNFRSRSVIITTNLLPEVWWGYSTPIDPVLRRVVAFYWFFDPDFEEPPQVFNKYSDLVSAVTQ